MPLSIPKPVLSGLISLCVLVGAMVSSAPALAARGHVFGSSFGSEGAGNGQLSSPNGVAVNEETGDVYVVDVSNNRVEYFSSTGAYAGQFNGSGADLAVEGVAAPTGQFSSPETIAIDNSPGSPSFGDVYVGDTGHEVIDKYSPTGAYIGQLTETSGGATFGEIIGLAVASNGALWVYQGSDAIDSFDGAVQNEFLSSRLAESGLGAGFSGHTFAVDSTEDFYIKSFFTGIVKLDSSGKVLSTDFDNLVKNPDAQEFPGAVAVDLSDNEVYVGNADGENSVARFSSEGSLIETFGSEHLSESSGIAVDSKTGEVYVGDAGADRVDRFVLEAEGRPTIEREAPADVATTSATLTARLKPGGPDTTYYFQYGTVDCAASPSSCTDLPVPPGVDLGEGFDSQSVNVHPTDLQPGTLYDFRIVATNELGTSEGIEQTFTTQVAGSGFALSDGRGWELVTPPDKHGAGLIAVGNEQGADIQASDSGDAITYGATSPFTADSAGSRSPEVTQVLSDRGAPGTWETQDITTPHTEGATELAIGHAAEYKLFSSDLSVGLVEPEGDTPLEGRPPGTETTLDREKTIYIRLANGEYKALVSSADVPAGTKFGGDGEGAGAVGFVTATPDASHVVLHSSVGLTATPHTEAGGLYEWAEGRLQLASALPDGEPTTASLGESDEIVRRAISNDGSRLVWSDGSLYMRDMVRGETVQVDAAQGAPEPVSSESHYKTANSEDSRVFFTSSQRLTADSTASTEFPGKPDLYEFELTSGEGEPLAGKLIDLTVDGNAGAAADVRGVIGASEDGSYVYFVANGVLGDGAEDGAKGGTCERGAQSAKETCNLYVEHYEEGTKAWASPRLIAVLSGNDAPTWGSGNADLSLMTSRVSPNGRYLAFMSERSLTGYENRDINSGVPDEEVFLYDASVGHMICASCDPTSARPVGIFVGGQYEERLVDYTRGLWENRWMAGNIPGWTTKDLTDALYQSRYLSNSGRLFFNSSDALVPGDVNGKEDVYEYEPAGIGSCQAPGYGRNAGNVFSENAGGCVGLISAGTSTEESAFMDASETGGDVFFLTTSRLSPQDADASADLYDAHECTESAPCAAPGAAVPPPCTTGDACKAAPTPQPAIFGSPSSEVFSGAGNVTPTPITTKTVTPKAATRTRAEKLAKALKACAKKSKSKRKRCEAQARKKYGPAHKAKKTNRRAK
jgi:NHL repeat